MLGPLTRYMTPSHDATLLYIKALNKPFQNIKAGIIVNQDFVHKLVYPCQWKLLYITVLYIEGRVYSPLAIADTPLSEKE